MSKTVKIAKLGGEVKEVFLEDDAELDAAIEASGLATAGCAIRVNGRSDCGTLRDGDKITIVPEVKGGC